MKKILMLGASFIQISAILRAKELGYYVITTDMKKDSPGNRYADESYDISTTDVEGILGLARKCRVDGILSYAADLSAPAAAVVCEKLGLPTNPYESVIILTRKNRFKRFMRENGYLVAEGESFTDYDEAYDYYISLDRTAVVKPIDAAGSRGVHKVDSGDRFKEAFDDAMDNSRNKEVIVEEFIEKIGYQIDGDGFAIDGKIRFFGVMDQHHDMTCNPYAPIGLSIPSIQEEKYRQQARELIQNIFDKLNMKFGGFNFEYLVRPDGQIHLLEIGPRNGGNFIPDTVSYATGIDMIEYSCRCAVGDHCAIPELPLKHEYASSYLVHSHADGRYGGLDIDESIQGNIVKQVMFVEDGEEIRRFRNGRDDLGAMVIRFDTQEEMLEKMDHMHDYIRVKVY